VSGVLKNALDWIVSSGELMDKPIAHESDRNISIARGYF
jgi:NAD(P)H-dependent FMN reductase